ncbi:MAG: hypothetical protein ACT4PO_13440, partial [Actinomycetota bacterium]
MSRSESSLLGSQVGFEGGGKPPPSGFLGSPLLRRLLPPLGSFLRLWLDLQEIAHGLLKGERVQANPAVAAGGLAFGVLGLFSHPFSLCPVAFDGDHDARHIRFLC